ncbi:membrane protein [Pseudomonas chlororaphis subsp. aurantiaca]|uniref:Putative membrane protein n=1 Tax=Pseudomonas chlororaphis TaxID=587753 RepID=A0A3G7TKJ9_9PSED|nr:MAPEG family protein [Pseudomonas chlororaphis]AZD21043.1 putative membrane protein [Pseudomonas chlororaphis subsp. aurantiaca]AZE47627.1 putative membrane protein [Pseudomonas chlororaphis]UVE47321.1 MAPEG family protein [Pseudomonas chlororaphis]BAV73754.1 membrane protein [Pseudomonas chlororaphis subsp. aurantiaca]BBN53671.1 membrane protein [Pseudomonas chlororaphis subsp. aurantiaca]
MSIAFWCVFISALLIYVARMPVARAMKEQGGYDNHLPRQQQAQLTGFGARALAAHQNSFEAFMLFAVGVLMAHTTQTQGWLIDGLAIVFVITRVIYLLCYWADLAWQRSLVWFIGLLCSLLLMLSPTFRSLLA